MSAKVSGSSGVRSGVATRKPKALGRGAQIAVFAPASPGSEAKVTAGIAELRRLGFVVELPAMQQPEGYFAASTEARGAELVRLLGDTKVHGVIGVRGGYGSNYLLDPTLAAAARIVKAVVGFSDLTSVQIFLWQQCGWVTFYGPMVAAGVGGGGGGSRWHGGQSVGLVISGSVGGGEISLPGGGLG